jgi:cobalt-zinc-cadmium efflux system protein
MAQHTAEVRDCTHRSPLSAEHRETFRRVLVLTVVVMAAEVAGGIAANSLALIADAGHMLADSAAIALGLFASWIAQRPASPARTYGYLRLEILAALANGAALLVISLFILWNGWQRLTAPVAVEPGLMLGIAAIGLGANLVALRMLHRGHRHSLNLRGVYLHVAGDLLGSVGALLAGGIIALTGWTRADALVSMVVALLILLSASRLVRESVDVLLEAVPRHISLTDVERRLASIPDVSSVHDLHVWTVTSGVIAMSGHAVVPDPASNQRVLEAAQGRMAELGIHHVTLQIERNDTCEERSEPTV